MGGCWTWTLAQVDPFHTSAAGWLVDWVLTLTAPTAMQKVDVTHETPFWSESSDADTFGVTVQVDAVTVAGTEMGAADAGEDPSSGTAAAKTSPTSMTTERIA